LKIVLLSVNAGHKDAAEEAGTLFIHKAMSPAELIAILTPLLRELQKTARDSSGGHAGEKSLLKEE
jgi:hypothetical protein